MALSKLKNPNPSQQEMQEANFRYKKNACNEFPVIRVTEEWKPIAIPGLQDWYYVSSYGRVYSKLYDCIMRQRFIGRGYLVVTLRMKDNSASDFLVHRLVMLAFNPIDNADEMQVNHKDPCKTKNTIHNLEWVTNKENTIHAYEHGLHKRGEQASFSIITNEQASMICKALELGYKDKECCIYANLPPESRFVHIVSQIRNRRNWKHISKNYNF